MIFFSLDIITFICAVLLFVYLYLNWPNRIKDKKVAPEEKETKRVSEIQSIYSKGNVGAVEKTEREGSGDLQKN